jgi:GT2 family glycosyltransferase/glycosyltransferase involved in cell wall biosynthesis
MRTRRRDVGMWSVRRDPEGHAHRYFDALWYERQVEGGLAGMDAWHHYRSIGVAQGLAPNAVFDVSSYRFDHPDVEDLGGDPLVHYVLRGRVSGATPHPLFDATWYRRTHHLSRRVDPYLHYLTSGRALGLAASSAVEPGTDVSAVRLAFPVPDRVAVTIVVPAYGNHALTYRCLYAVASRTPVRLGAHVVLADDCPEQPLGPALGAVPGLEVRLNPLNLGFVRNCNAAAAGALGDHLVFLNNDTVVESGWLEALLEATTGDARVGMVGGKLLGGDGRLQEAGVIMYQDANGDPYGRGDDPDRPEYGYRRDVDCVSGACILVDRVAFEAAGGFDEAFVPAFFEEYDLAFRLRAQGRRIVYQPDCRVLHAGSATYGIGTRDRQTRINRARFVARWMEELATQRRSPADVFLARERPHPGGVVLVIDDRIPETDRHAGALLTWQHLRLLADGGHKVVYLPDDGVVRQPYTHDLQRQGIEVLAPGVDMHAWLDDNGRYLDWVLLARPGVAERWIPPLRRWSTAALVYFTHDLHYLRERRRHEVTGDVRALADSLFLEAQESMVLRSVDAALTPSSAEVAVIRALAPDLDVRVLGPCLDADRPPAPPGAQPLEARESVMFLGGFDHLPNVDAATVLVREVMPIVWQDLPDVRVLIVGNEPPPAVAELASERVEVTGFVPDLGPWFAKARMTVSPLRYGAGLKGKIVTSLEAGVPVITTTIGNEGLDLEAGVEALIGDRSEAIAAHVVRVFREPGLAAALADAGWRAVSARFSWLGAQTALSASLAAARAHRDRGRS